MDIALVYLLLIGFGILVYVLLDGFSLGVGILSPLLNTPEDKGLAMKSLAHLWDSNQTWLVFGGVVLFVAFPSVYSYVLSNLYIPIILMLIALIFRGVAFEFRFKADSSQKWWDISFAVGSTLATFCQGLILGALVGDMSSPKSLDEPLQWLTPFSIHTGVALVVGYALLGSCWLIRKTEDGLQQRVRMLAKVLLVGMLFFLAMVSVEMLLEQPAIASRWLDWPGNIWLAPMPLLTAFFAYKLWNLLNSEEEHSLKPLAYVMGLFATAFAGLVAGIFPYIIPGRLTIWDAIAPDKSVYFTLVGILIFIPIIIAYNVYNYKTFSGKTSLKDGY
ncbi:cytochrome d ubiquinol oxidase subunit II [Litoribrevibacter albus]|uniref:Ubiquinol oxidase subunit II, cyanide insensitive n=1 Tax=Litoribrevibacter albus TaxID=1473156 RepID=A0AA37W667_9GAMM|nr:cytochrome d ubiquinol oxidase subunit II [Litoribrevibacter albus]GLQ29579.1 ubiquinol oxidase subunit II, cyanide insensitive [Litoribrevibacter albus]